MGKTHRHTNIHIIYIFYTEYTSFTHNYTLQWSERVRKYQQDCLQVSEQLFLTVARLRSAHGSEVALHPISPWQCSSATLYTATWSRGMKFCHRPLFPRRGTTTVYFHLELNLCSCTALSKDSKG